MSILIASFDIGKKNFAFVIEEVNLNSVKSIKNIPKKQRYNKDGTCKYEFQDILNDLYKYIPYFNSEFVMQENNNILIKECYEKIDDLLSLSKKNQVKCFLSGKDDDLNVFIEIHAGAGGTESQDWADMLKKMYVRWLDKKDCTL